jgi:hypothetical protein
VVSSLVTSLLTGLSASDGEGPTGIIISTSWCYSLRAFLHTSHVEMMTARGGDGGTMVGHNFIILSSCLYELV